jgi:hypothetical protein
MRPLLFGVLLLLVAITLHLPNAAAAPAPGPRLTLLCFDKDFARERDAETWSMEVRASVRDKVEHYLMQRTKAEGGKFVVCLGPFKNTKTAEKKRATLADALQTPLFTVTSASLTQGQAPEQSSVRKLSPTLSPASTPLQLHAVAYASEKVECSNISGDWVTLYRGTVVERDAQTVALRLEERFGYRYYPNQDGLNRTDWWCIPRRRHCYAPIAFSDWGGTFSKDSVQRFPSARVYDAQLGLINGMAPMLQQQCHRNADGRKKR